MSVVLDSPTQSLRELVANPKKYTDMIGFAHRMALNLVEAVYAS